MYLDKFILFWALIYLDIKYIFGSGFNFVSIDVFLTLQGIAICAHDLINLDKIIQIQFLLY